MSNYNNKDIKPSGKTRLSISESEQEALRSEQILQSDAKLKKLSTDIDELRKEMNELKKDKTPYGVIMKGPVIFVCGLFIGVLVMGFVAWHEIVERKELRKELIEYVDKMFTRTGTIGEMMYKDMQANQQNTQESKQKDDGVVDGDFKDLNE